MIEVLVYLLPIKKVKDLGEEYFSNFPNRLNKSKKFRNEEDSLRCLSVAVLLKEILGITEKDIEIGEHGKPYSPSTFKKFSISHSGEFAVLAVSSVDVGVDVEKNDSRHFSVADHVFTHTEQDYIHDDIKNRFFIIWTLKESASKYNGLGISMDYKSFSVLPIINGEAIEYNGQKIFGNYEIIDDYTLSVCSSERFETKLIFM